MEIWTVIRYKSCTVEPPLNVHWFRVFPYLMFSFSDSKSVISDYLHIRGATRQHSWLRHHATSWKVAGLSPDELDLFFSIYLILPAALCP
jgi:hypothetical protein